MSNKKQQKVQNAAARITLRMPRTEHTTPHTSQNVHWLPISSRNAYKIDSICHTSLTTAYPKYLSELLTIYTPARPLRSSSDPDHPHCSYNKDQVIRSENIRIPETQQLEQSP